MLLVLEKCECSIADIISFINDLNDFKKNKKNKQKTEFIFNFLLKKKNLTKITIKNILLQASKGLKYLHSQNIIHRFLNLYINLLNFEKILIFQNFFKFSKKLLNFEK